MADTRSGKLERTEYRQVCALEQVCSIGDLRGVDWHAPAFLQRGRLQFSAHDGRNFQFLNKAEQFM